MVRAADHWAEGTSLVEVAVRHVVVIAKVRVGLLGMDVNQSKAKTSQKEFADNTFLISEEKRLLWMYFRLRGCSSTENI